MAAIIAVVVLALLRHFIHVTSPNGSELEVAVDQIIIIRPSDDSLHPEAKCMIATSDGKFSAVKETCAEVEEKIDEVYRSRRQE